MVSLEDVQAVLRKLILEIGTNDKVIFIAPNAPRPQLNHTVIELISVEQMGFDYEVENKANETVDLYGRRKLIYTIHCYGKNCMNEANRLYSMMSFTTTTDFMDSQGLVSMAIADVEQVEYDYILRDDTYEKYCYFDIYVNAVIEDGTTQVAPGFFDTIEPLVWANRP